MRRFVPLDDFFLSAAQESSPPTNPSSQPPCPTQHREPIFFVGYAEAKGFSVNFNRSVFEPK